MSREQPWGMRSRSSELTFHMEDPASLRGISDAILWGIKLHYYQDESIPCWLQQCKDVLVHPILSATQRLFHAPGLTPFISNDANSALGSGQKEAVLFSIQLHSPTNLALLEFQACWRGNIMHGEKGLWDLAAFGF